MTFIKVFHNPTAGDAEHTREKLVRKIKSAGYQCSYSSTKKDIAEKRIPAQTDVVAVAGGDGTVRKMAEFYCSGNVLTRRHPLAIIPCGTANNIATALGIRGNTDEVIARWRIAEKQNFDIGKVHGLKENHFFLEAVGFGVFPKLIKIMRDRSGRENDPEAELKVALETLREIVRDYRPKQMDMVLDGQTYSGEYLMVEIMNIKSIGPNLNMAPSGDFSDGVLDVIAIGEDQRDALLRYIDQRITNGKDMPFFHTPLRAKEIKVNWGGRLMHIDDELVEADMYQKLDISILRDVLTFLV